MFLQVQGSDQSKINSKYNIFLILYSEYSMYHTKFLNRYRFYSSPVALDQGLEEGYKKRRIANGILKKKNLCTTRSINSCKIIG